VNLTGVKVASLIDECFVHNSGPDLGVGEVGGCLRRQISPFFRGGTSKATIIFFKYK